jgi:ketosteroid isomerase-like protein
MSQENVEVMKAAFEAWNAGDMDALREMYDPDVIVRMPEGWPEPGPYFGREAVMRQFEQLRETWDTDAAELISDFIDVGDRVALRFIWRGAGQGPESNIELTTVQTVRNGKILDIVYFWDHAQALKAVGLSEQDAHAES